MDPSSHRHRYRSGNSGKGSDTHSGKCSDTHSGTSAAEAGGSAASAGEVGEHTGRSSTGAGRSDAAAGEVDTDEADVTRSAKLLALVAKPLSSSIAFVEIFCGIESPACIAACARSAASMQASRFEALKASLASSDAVLASAQHWSNCCRAKDGLPIALLEVGTAAVRLPPKSFA